MSDTSTPARVEKMNAGKIVVCLILLLYLLAVGGFAVYIIVVRSLQSLDRGVSSRSHVMQLDPA